VGKARARSPAAIAGHHRLPFTSSYAPLENRDTPWLSFFGGCSFCRLPLGSRRQSPGSRKVPYQTTLGIAQYRAGQFAEALATLTRGDPLCPDEPATLAFLSITQWKLGHPDHALETLRRLRQLVQPPGGMQQDEVHAFLREAEEFVRMP